MAAQCPHGRGIGGRDLWRSRGELPVRAVACRIEGGNEIMMLAITLLDHHVSLAAELAMARPGITQETRLDA